MTPTLSAIKDFKRKIRLSYSKTYQFTTSRIILILASFFIFSDITAACWSTNFWLVRCRLIVWWHRKWSPSLHCSPGIMRDFGRLISPKQDPHIEIRNTINQSFCRFLECQVPFHERKAPILKIFCRRFCTSARLVVQVWWKLNRKSKHMDVRLALSKIKPRISKPVSLTCRRMLSGAQISLNLRWVCLGDKCANERLVHLVHVESVCCLFVVNSIRGSAKNE